MEKNTIKAYLVSGYNRHAYTHNYIVGVKRDGLVYACVCCNFDLAMLAKAEKGSSHSDDSWCLRWRANEGHREQVFAAAEQVFAVCTVDELERVAAEISTGRKNRGSAFEKVLTEHYGQVWNKDSLPFYKGADLVVDGVDYQVKYEGCNFTNEKTLRELERA